jgi:hypothetical protein
MSPTQNNSGSDKRYIYSQRPRAPRPPPGPTSLADAAIEIGGCLHVAIREDISANRGALEQLQAKFDCQLLLVESRGDNLAANSLRELSFIDKVPLLSSLTRTENRQTSCPT